MPSRNDGIVSLPIVVPEQISVNKMPTDESFMFSDIHEKVPGICENFSRMLEELNDCCRNNWRRRAAGENKSVSEKTQSTNSPEDLAVEETHGGFFNCGEEEKMNNSVDDDKSPVVDIDTSNHANGLQSPLSDITTGIPGPAQSSVSSFSAESVTPKKSGKVEQKEVEEVKKDVEQQVNEPHTDTNEAKEEQKEPEEQTEKKACGRWRTVQDPLSGRTYFFNTMTRQTTWTDPNRGTSPPFNENVQFKSKAYDEQMALPKASKSMSSTKAKSQPPNESKEKKKSMKGFFKRLSMKAKKSKRPQNESMRMETNEKDLDNEKSVQPESAERSQNQAQQEEDDWMSLRDPDAWVEAKDPATGHKYFYNILTRKSTWTDMGNLSDCDDNKPSLAQEEEVIETKPKSEIDFADMEIGEGIVRICSFTAEEEFEHEMEKFEAIVEQVQTDEWKYHKKRFSP